MATLPLWCITKSDQTCDTLVNTPQVQPTEWEFG